MVTEYRDRDGPQLQEALGALEAAAVAFCDAVLASSSKSVGVILGTPASAEIAQEPALRFDWNAEPVRTAHSIVRLGHFFVIDQLRALARLATMYPPALYAPFVVARSLLDAAGVTYWLGDPEIGAVRRVQRRLVSDLIEAGEQRIPDRPEFVEKAAEVEETPQRVRDFCSHHSWQVSTGRPPQVGTEVRLSRPQLIGAVIDSDASALANGLGGTLWWFLSGHTHSSSGALISVIEAGDSADPARPNAVLVVDGVKLIWLLVAGSKAARRLTTRRHALFGDMADDVESLGHALDGQLLRYLEAARSGTLPADETRTAG